MPPCTAASRGPAAFPRAQAAFNSAAIRSHTALASPKTIGALEIFGVVVGQFRKY